MVLLKNFACLLFSYQCSCCFLSFLLSATAFIYYHLLFCLSTTFFNFFCFIFALSKKALKTNLYFVDLLLPCSATLDTIHPTIDKSQQQKYKNIKKRQSHKKTLPFYHLYSNFYHIFTIQSKIQHHWYNFSHHRCH